jgi:hypothetical protein
MSRQSNEEVLMRNYLLGVIDEAQQEQVEERLLSDDGFAERLSTAQDNLIDDYVFGALSESERESFDQNFILTDERRKKMLLAQTIEIYVDEHQGLQAPQLNESHLPSPWWRNPVQLLQSYRTWLALSAIGLLLVFLTPKIVRWFKPPDQAALVREQRAKIERQVAALNRGPADQQPQGPATYELALQPTLLREDGGIKRVTLTGDIKLLTLKLVLPQSQHEKYNALMLTGEGEELFAIEGLTPQADAGGAVVLLKIPSEFLARDDYQIQLRGAGGDSPPDSVVRYYFRVLK